MSLSTYHGHTPGMIDRNVLAYLHDLPRLINLLQGTAAFNDAGRRRAEEYLDSGGSASGRCVPNGLAQIARLAARIVREADLAAFENPVPEYILQHERDDAEFPLCARHQPTTMWEATEYQRGVISVLAAIASEPRAIAALAGSTGVLRATAIACCAELFADGHRPLQ